MHVTVQANMSHRYIHFECLDFTGYTDLTPCLHIQVHVIQSFSTLGKQSLILDCCMDVAICMQHARKTSQIHVCYMKHAYCMHVAGVDKWEPMSQLWLYQDFLWLYIC